MNPMLQKIRQTKNYQVNKADSGLKNFQNPPTQKRLIIQTMSSQAGADTLLAFL
jgi:hypothetical protein